MNIKNQLKLIQKLTGESQEKLAQRLGVSFATLNSWINGRSNPREGYQKAIEELYLKVTGQQTIPKTVLEAKEKAVFSKKKKHKDIVSQILNNSDIYDQLTLSLTFNTNRIEGSTLSEAETEAILFQNQTIENKSLVEHMEAKNHQEAFRFLLEHIKHNKQITEKFILMLHGKLMNGINTEAGYYRRHAVRIVGTHVPTANYIKVPKLMEELVKDIQKKQKSILSLITTVHSRFEQIHPFSDGNGRIGRLIIQAMLLKENLAPALIDEKNRRYYMMYLNKAQMGQDVSLLEDFMCDAVLSGYDLVERRG